MLGRKINLGSGANILKDYINIDIFGYGQEIIRDVERGLPFDDVSIEEVKTIHFLEHIEDLVFVMNEIYRVLIPEGKLVAIVPKYPISIMDPTHKKFFNKESVYWWEWAHTARKEVKAKFKVIDYKEEGNEIKFTMELQ